MESGAILLYLAEKTGKFIPEAAADRSRAQQWLFFQAGGVGPMFGQFGHFHKYAKDKCDHPYPEERYANETKRLLGVMEEQLENSKNLATDEVTIVDFATAPWVIALSKFYKADDRLELASFRNVNKWVESLKDRPAFSKGLEVCAIN